MAPASTAPAQDAIRISQLVKRFGDVAAVKDVNISVPRGAFLVLVGFLTFGVTMFYERRQANLTPFFFWHPWVYLLLVPAATMGTPVSFVRFLMRTLKCKRLSNLPDSAL